MFVKNIERRAERRIKDILLIEKLKNNCQYEGANEDRRRRGQKKFAKSFFGRHETTANTHWARRLIRNSLHCERTS